VPWVVTAVKEGAVSPILGIPLTLFSRKVVI